MAIRVGKTTVPQPGRVTLPKGTFLNSPSTAADGFLGQGSSGLPPTPQVPIGWQGNPGYGEQPVNTVKQWYSPITTALSQVGTALNNADKELRGVTFTPVRLPGVLGQIQDVFAPAASMTPWNKPNSYVSPFSQDAKAQASVSQYGDMPSPNDYGKVIPMNIANQTGALDGLTPAQVSQQMIAAGYTQKWVQDLGQVWTKTGSGTGQPVVGSGDRPEWVDGASLAPGQDVTLASGTRVVGGTPTADGTAQYAVNYANPNAARDTKGRYKWVSEVRKDNNGNWVRINKQVLRKVYTRSHLKNKANKAQQPTQSGTQNDIMDNQLVNFRAGFG